MAFDPKKLIKTAEHLSSLNNDEETVRSMINRAYYAAFGIAMKKLKIRTSVDVHATVIRALMQSDNKNFRNAGKGLEALRKNRVEADYDYEKVIRYTAFQNVINDADYIIENLTNSEVSS